MNGHLIPDTPIMVDLWKRVSNPSSKYYFLSHMHSDHTQGLSASWRWPIYCSPLSAKLLVEKFQIKEHLVRPLELYHSHLIRLDHVSSEMMTVTLFDANHCPGSVMFLFEGYFGRILYTGDFRYDPSTFPESFLGPGRPVDKLYLDNTFNNPRCRFPSRRDCKQEILEILANYQDHEIVLGVYTLGKEDLLVDIALALSTRVVVSPARMRMLQVLELLDVFTTDQDGGHVRLVPRRAISKRNMARWNEEAPTIAIIPTGLFSSLGGQPFISQDDVFIIPYSDHSSYPELRQFVSRVCPRTIIPIVKDSSSMSSVMDMHNFDDLLDRSPSAPFDIPPSVLQFMSTEHSRSTHLSDSCTYLKSIIELKKGQIYTRRNSHAAMGVVFQDDDEQEETKSADSVEQIKCSVDSQLAENKSSNTYDEQTLSQQKILNNSGEARSGSISHHLLEGRMTEATPSEALTVVGNTTSLIEERKEARWVSKSSPNEPTRGLSSENEGNRIPQKPPVRTKDFLTNACKRKSDEIVKAKNSNRLEADSVLIRSLSNKRRRVLPASFVNAPKVPENVQSTCSTGTGDVCTKSSKNIQDYFKCLVSVETSGPAKSTHNPCDLDIASTSFQDTDAVSRIVYSASATSKSIQKAVVDGFMITKVKPQQKSVINKGMQDSLSDDMHIGNQGQSIAGPISNYDKFETPSISAEETLETLPQQKTDYWCQTRMSLGRVCIKPIRQRSAGQTDRGLREAFKNIFADQVSYNLGRSREQKRGGTL